jgi:DNA polymerase
LFQSDRRREAGRPAANNDHVEFHRFAWGQVVRHGRLLRFCYFITETGTVAQRPGPGHVKGMDALGLMLLQMEWGADEALEETPADRLRPPPVVAVRPAPGRTRSEPERPVGTPVERAIRAAAQADSLEALKAAIAGFEPCPLRDMATNMVFVAGDPDADVLLIGGAPGADEDRSGVPFSGRDGALLDQMLGSVGLQRANLLLAPLIPWRPPGGRVPNPGELQLYRPFLARMIALTAPSRIVFFGTLAASTVLGTAQRARTIEWAEKTVDGRTTPVLILPALGDLLKTPARRKDAWAGMRLLRRALGG